MTVVKVAQQREQPRWPVLLTARITAGTYKVDAAVNNLSTMGCMLERKTALPTSGYILFLFQGFPLSPALLFGTRVMLPE